MFDSVVAMSKWLDPNFTEYVRLLSCARNGVDGKDHFFVNDFVNNYKVYYPCYTLIENEFRKLKDIMQASLQGKKELTIENMHYYYDLKMYVARANVEINSNNVDRSKMFIHTLPIIEKLDALKKQKKIKQLKRQGVQPYQSYIDNVNILKKFPFKTKDECNSKSTTKPYYISKHDILQIINNDKTLSNKITRKNMTKSETCDFLFD